MKPCSARSQWRALSSALALIMPELIPTSVLLEGEEAQCVYERPSPTTPICMKGGHSAECWHDHCLYYSPCGGPAHRSHDTLHWHKRQWTLKPCSAEHHTHCETRRRKTVSLHRSLCYLIPTTQFDTYLDVARVIVMGSVHEHGVRNAGLEHTAGGRREKAGHRFPTILEHKPA